MDGATVSPVEKLKAPCSIDSATSLRIVSSSSAVGRRSSLRPTAERTEEWPTWGAMLMLMPLDSSASAQPSRSFQFHGWTDAMSGSPAPSGPLGPMGNGEKPQLPVTSVVTPWNTLLSPPGSSRRVTSEWECMSMNPGHTTSPAASTTRAACASSSLPTAAILPPARPTSAWYRSPPVPSITVPFLISVSSCMAPPWCVVIRRFQAAILAPAARCPQADASGSVCDSDLQHPSADGICRGHVGDGQTLQAAA